MELSHGPGIWDFVPTCFQLPGQLLRFARANICDKLTALFIVMHVCEQVVTV